MYRGRRGYAMNSNRGFYRSYRGRGRMFRGGMRDDYVPKNVDTVIMPGGESVNIRPGGPPPARNSGRGSYGSNRRGRDRGRYRSRSENMSNGERPRDDNVKIPSRPLTRVVARARARSQSETKQENDKENTHPEQDAYRMEVNEYVRRSGNSSPDSQGSKTIPCVTIRDMHTFIGDRKQRRVWIPVAVCEQLIRAIKKCKVGETYDIDKLEANTFVCPATKKIVEIEKDEGHTRLRTYMDVPGKDEYKDGDLIEIIDLRNELIARLLKFLDDVATRYRKIKSQMVIPSLYSYSGERRFYFDLRETRWGHRLHISQVTDMHRNVIGIPLETVVEFKDRLMQVIDFLELQGEGDVKKRSANGKRSKKRQFKRNGKSKGEKKASSDESPEKAAPDGDAADEHESDAKVEPQVAEA